MSDIRSAPGEKVSEEEWERIFHPELTKEERKDAHWTEEELAKIKKHLPMGEVARMRAEDRREGRGIGFFGEELTPSEESRYIKALRKAIKPDTEAMGR